jgi:hypothetical protein
MILSFTELGYHGELGNQLFEIAAVIGASKKYECDYLFPNKIPHMRSGEMLGYNKNAYFIKNAPSKFVDPEYFKQFSKVTYSCLTTFYWPIQMIDMAGNDLLDFRGFFQSWKYFDNCEDEVRKIFKLDAVRQQRNIAVGFRLTDYLEKEDFYWNLSKTDYYKKAFKVFGKTAKYKVFSDDIQMAMKIISDMSLNGYDITPSYSSGYDALCEMAGSHGYICPNSTFILWAAYLGDPKQKKTVIVPKNWYVKPEFDAKDLYLNYWTLL